MKQGIQVSKLWQNKSLNLLKTLLNFTPVNGCCIISHGSSNAKAICSAIRQASEFVQKDVITQIRDNIDKEEIWSHDTEVK